MGPAEIKTYAQKMQGAQVTKSLLTHQFKHVFWVLKRTVSLRWWCSKEPSIWDGSFEHPQHMFWLKNKKNNFPVHTLIWRPADFFRSIVLACSSYMWASWSASWSITTLFSWNIILQDKLWSLRVWSIFLTFSEIHDFSFKTPPRTIRPQKVIFKKFSRWQQKHEKLEQQCRWYTSTNTRFFTCNLYLGVKVTQNVAHYPLQHVTMAPAKFEVATSNG